MSKEEIRISELERKVENLDGYNKMLIDKITSLEQQINLIRDLCNTYNERFDYLEWLKNS